MFGLDLGLWALVIYICFLGICHVKVTAKVAEGEGASAPVKDQDRPSEGEEDLSQVDAAFASCAFIYYKYIIQIQYI